MAHFQIYVGPSVSELTELPSPVEIQGGVEQIWSAPTGRAQEGPEQAEMIGDSITDKDTCTIKWENLTPSEFNDIKAGLPRGFFYLGIGLSLSEARRNAVRYYRGALTYTIGQGLTPYYKEAIAELIQK